MRIKLIYPKMHDTSRGTRVKYRLVPPLSLLALAAVTPKPHTVTICDENVTPLRLDDTPDLVGITVYVSSSRRAYEIAGAYRRRGIPVVLGGLHASALPYEAAKRADAVVIGEGDEVWVDVVRDAERGRLHKFYSGEAVDLDSMPVPDRNLIPGGTYLTKNSLVASRGCNRRCVFCYRTSRPKDSFRKRSPAVVADEISRMQKGYVALLDDNLVADRPFARELFRQLRQCGVLWMGAASLDVARDERLLDLMAESGCISLFIGIETLNQRNLDAMQKGSNRVATYTESIERIRQRAIMVNGSFVFGFDDDRADVFDRTVAWAQSVRLDTATFHILTPYPGTPLFTQMEGENRLLSRNWDHYDTAHVVFRPKHMSPEELRAGYERAYDAYYTWRAIAQRVTGDSWGQLPRFLLNIGYKRMNSVWPWLCRRGLAALPFRVFLAAARRERQRAASRAKCRPDVALGEMLS